MFLLPIDDATQRRIVRAFSVVRYERAHLVKQPPQFLHRFIVVVDTEIYDRVALILMYDNSRRTLAVRLTSGIRARAYRMH